MAIITNRDAVRVPWRNSQPTPAQVHSWPVAFTWHHVFPCSRFCNLWNAIVNSYRHSRQPEGPLAVRQFLGLCGMPAPQVDRWVDPIRSDPQGFNWEALFRAVVYPPWNIVEGPHTSIRDGDPGDAHIDRFVHGLTPGDQLRMRAVETFYERVQGIPIQADIPPASLRAIASAATLARSVMQRNTEPIRFRLEMWARVGTSDRWIKRRA
jgi:hypothetical protein